MVEPAGFAAAPALSTHRVGRGPWAPNAAEQTKDAACAADTGPNHLFHWAASWTRGGESPVGSVSALLNNGGAGAAPGFGRGLGYIPAMGEDGGSYDLDGAPFSFCCLRLLAAALRAQRCRPHFGDGETKALADSFSKPTTVSPVSTC